jgi:hypothetical protein
MDGAPIFLWEFSQASNTNPHPSDEYLSPGTPRPRPPASRGEEMRQGRVDHHPTKAMIQRAAAFGLDGEIVKSLFFDSMITTELCDIYQVPMGCSLEARPKAMLWVTTRVTLRPTFSGRVA